MQALKYFKFSALLQREGWLMPAFVGVDANGIIQYLSELPPDYGIATESVPGYVLPGFCNAHSHAFQYAMAGAAEIHSVGIDDDFWTWREAMYQCALSVDPEQMENIAAMLYTEMLRNGYTHVCEFHYLHHDKNGKPYLNLAEMGERLLVAAKRAGIRITLIPVFYQRGGFGKAAQPRQRRFLSAHTTEYLKLLDASLKLVQQYEHARLGFSVHSLRAVNFEDIIETFSATSSALPFHIHVAEQLKEVSECVDACGARPMQWVLDHLPVSDRFNLVHSTHLDEGELKRVASSGATVVLCPSTEGNLGDGIFPMREYCQANGRWCIGTDSHIGLQPLEELRMVDYRQRITSHLRNTFQSNAAMYMVNESTIRGRLAAGKKSIDNFEVGEPFDAVVYGSSPLLDGVKTEHLLPSIVYHHDSSCITGTIVGGRWMIRHKRHTDGNRILVDFQKTIKQLTGRQASTSSS
jgi:formimidoylglutamate deiminase